MRLNKLDGPDVDSEELREELFVLTLLLIIAIIVIIGLQVWHIILTN